MTEEEELAVTKLTLYGFTPYTQYMTYSNSLLYYICDGDRACMNAVHMDNKRITGWLGYTSPVRLLKDVEQFYEHNRVL